MCPHVENAELLPWRLETGAGALPAASQNKAAERAGPQGLKHAHQHPGKDECRTDPNEKHDRLLNWLSHQGRPLTTKITLGMRQCAYDPGGEVRPVMRSSPMQSKCW